jgi:hypothetical protein
MNNDPAIRLNTAHPNARPDFMATLGLLPPYTPEDIEKAYLTKVKESHPDRGGTQQAFFVVQNAYIQAKQYVKFRGDRRGWIAKQIDEYLAVQEIIAKLQQFGAQVEINTLDWLKKSFGEFAQLTEQVAGIRLNGAANGDDVLQYMVSHHDRLLELRRLDLADSNVSDNSIRQLGVFRRLTELNLNRTPVTAQALEVVQWLPELETVHIDVTAIGWLSRQRLAARLRQNRKAAANARTLHPTNVR